MTIERIPDTLINLPRRSAFSLPLGPELGLRFDSVCLAGIHGLKIVEYAPVLLDDLD
mgnify:FL=1